MPLHLILYGTSACHLCEQAETLILDSLAPGECYLEKIDISEDAVLLDKYGMLIPVLRQEGREGELHWPFNREKLQSFLTLSF